MQFHDSKTKEVASQGCSRFVIDLQLLFITPLHFDAN